MSFHVPETFRITTGRAASDPRFGNNGAFRLPARPGEVPLMVIATDQGGWEHVSVSLPTRCPTWPEMCRVKALFWDGEDCVVQFHPPESEYVNNHRFCLHMWRRIGCEFETPPGWMVGVKALGVIA